MGTTKGGIQLLALAATSVIGCESRLQPPLVRTLVIAHRGEAATRPENTIAAFLAAAEHGADFVELDVHQSRDGVPVVIHDPTLERTTNGAGRVSGQTAVELGRLDAGSWFERAYSGETVPTLGQTLIRFKPSSLRFLIEVKGDAQGRPYPGFEEQVLGVIREHDMIDRVVLDTYYPPVIETFKRLAPEIPIAFDPSPADYAAAETGGPEVLPVVALSRGADILSARHKAVTSDVVNEAVRRGVPIWVWGVKGKRRMRQLALWGVEGVMTKHPGRLREVLDELHAQR